MRAILRSVAVAAVSSLALALQSTTTPLPLKEGSLKFAVLGDFGDASKLQYETAAQFAKAHDRFPFEMVILTGDNLIGSERPQDFKEKFETPYKPLLDAGVKFYGSRSEE